jgi:Xaa-Pro aminopeptidase
MPWDKKQIKYHLQAAKILKKINDEGLIHVKNKPETSEYDLCQFILKRFKDYNLKTNHRPIVSFRENTSFVHYYPKENSKKLRPESLIMIDLWARLNKKKAPFADLTFMAYYGKNIPREIKNTFRNVILARNAAINFIKDKLNKKILPTGKEIDSAARNFLKAKKLAKYFFHTTGHVLGRAGAHGRGGRLSQKNKKPIKIKLGYTIEPGVYLKKFGARSEIDFYINSRYSFILTSFLQNKIFIIN